MSVDERIRTTLDIEAASVSPPGLDLPALRAQAGRVRRRHRVTAMSVAAVAVAAAAGVGALLVPHPSPQPSPAPRPHQVVLPTGPPPPSAVWYDADGLHHGKHVYAVPGTAAPISIALVRDGAVYLVPSTLHIRYQPWNGPARDIGHGSREANWLLGPGSGPDGTTAAWFDGPDLVMYDTARGAELARVAQPGRRVMPYYEREFGTRFRYVDDRYVVWDGQDGRVLRFDRTSGRTTALSGVASHGDRPHVVDWRPDLVASSTHGVESVTVTSVESQPVPLRGVQGDGPVRFSPTGRYLVALAEPAGEATPADAAEPVLMDTFDGSSWRPVTSTRDASVGWGYGDTLMYLQSGGTGGFDDPAPLVVYDARARHLVAVHHRGEVILPAN